MYIRKITGYKFTCQNCGTQISMTADEFKQYKEEIEGYAGSSIFCTETNSEGKREEVIYHNFDCPVCGHYIPTTVHPDSADKFGFRHSNKIEVVYGNYDEVSMKDYLEKEVFGIEDES